MSSPTSKKTTYQRIIYFFPFQLLLLNLKRNYVMMFFWLLLFLAIFNAIGTKYGIPYLYLSPEYLGTVNFWSFFVMGFSLGGFVMAFNISCYIQSGSNFPFLATLSKPFARFCTNNSLIPLLFIITYLICSFNFLDKNEIINRWEIIKIISGLPIGYSIFIVVSMAYFMATNKDFIKIFGKEAAKIISSKSKSKDPARMVLHKRKRTWFERSLFDKTCRVDSYLGSRLRLRMSRPFAHYDENMLSQVFRQNHINASFFEIVVILSFICLGFFRNIEALEIPAGATIILFFTMLMMIVSAVRSWLHGWTFFVLLSLFLLINFLSRYDNYYFNNEAYGIDYNQLIPYNDSLLVSAYTDSLEHSKDVRSIKEVLDKWKNSRNSMGTKPKAIFVTSSGGGSRAALWTMHAMQHMDSSLNGGLMEQTVMITGSSGGMIGAAYFRELFRRSSPDLYNKQKAMSMGKDLLNPVILSMATSDIIRLQKFEYNGKSYWKDRGYAFEQRLNEITDSILDVPLASYLKAEKSAEIPMMILSPSIVPDGRRLLISPLRMSFLSSFHSSDNLNMKANVENVEYLSTFRKNDPLDLRFLTALRMSASFPYIMPTVEMPTKPSIEVFDAGLRDNYGIKTTVKFIFALRDWLENNTSGIIILQIRDGLKNTTKSHEGKRTLLDQFWTPFGSLYGNWFNVQDFNNDELLVYMGAWYDGPVDIINYELNKSYEENISLSWHLTALEKAKVLHSIEMPQNKKALERLKKLLGEE